jgi:hypothetical protein
VLFLFYLHREVRVSVLWDLPGRDWSDDLAGLVAVVTLCEASCDAVHEFVGDVPAVVTAVGVSTAVVKAMRGVIATASSASALETILITTITAAVIAAITTAVIATITTAVIVAATC